MSTTYSIRDAIRYLDRQGLDISEMRMRTLVRKDPIFTGGLPPGQYPDGAVKSALEGTEIPAWKINQKALDEFVQATRAGLLRRGGGGTRSDGTKKYSIWLNATQFAELRDWCADRDLREPERANKTSKTNKKSQPGASHRQRVAAYGNGGEAEDEAETLDLLDEIMTEDET